MSGREELTAESEALLEDFDRVGTNSHRLRDHLAAIEAAAVTRHVRETGCGNGFTDDHEVCDQRPLPSAVAGTSMTGSRHGTAPRNASTSRTT